MHWKKLGLIWKPDGSASWARTHGMCPTPYLINDKIIRVFVTCRDDKGRGRPGFVDVSAEDPCRVLSVSNGPLMDVGLPGSFDDNGIVMMSIVELDPAIMYMYYVGFEICTQIRYRVFTGLAISRDGGMFFNRHSRIPVLDRTDGEIYFRCNPFVMRDGGMFKLWYAAGSSWTKGRDGKDMPVYDLRYQESQDGIHWAPIGQIVMPITNGDEHGYSRPWVIKRGPEDYRLFFSIRRRSVSAYRLGYAESKNGIEWIRKDEEMNLDVSSGGFDSDAIMYSAVLSTGKRTYCFYNGNNFGELGFAAAELIE
jgi:hypothetical protein